MDVTGKRGNCMKRYGYVHSSHAVADQGILLQAGGGWVPISWKGGDQQPIIRAIVSKNT